MIPFFKDKKKKGYSKKEKSIINKSLGSKKYPKEKERN
jgi:hypothetical protein